MAHVEEFFVPLPESVSAHRVLDVLLVEDDEADTFLMTRALRSIPRIGRIVHARDGVEALEALDVRAFDPDVAIIDLHMPRKSGFSLLVELGCRDDQMHTLVMTSSKSSWDAARSKLRGAGQFFTKPDTLDEFNKVLSAAIADL